jgi:hypothetical protein
MSHQGRRGLSKDHGEGRRGELDLVSMVLVVEAHADDFWRGDRGQELYACIIAVIGGLLDKRWSLHSHKLF